MSSKKAQKQAESVNARLKLVGRAEEGGGGDSEAGFAEFVCRMLTHPKLTTSKIDSRYLCPDETPDEISYKILRSHTAYWTSMTRDISRKG